jgi:outer membrane cobalamin receptor
MNLLWMLFAVNGGTSAAMPPATVVPAATPPTEIIVTGSRVATRPDELAANVTVLSREDFDVEKPARLADLLRRVAGVHIDQVGGRGGTGSLYMRGADPNYTLVLVDGVRVNDPTNARGGRSTSPPSTWRTWSAWKSRAARTRRCTAATRSPAW